MPWKAFFCRRGLCVVKGDLVVVRSDLVVVRGEFVQLEIRAGMEHWVG